MDEWFEFCDNFLKNIKKNSFYSVVKIERIQRFNEHFLYAVLLSVLVLLYCTIYNDILKIYKKNHTLITSASNRHLKHSKNHKKIIS